MDQQPKITRLPRNGPRQGQSTEQWLYGKGKEDRRWSQASAKASTQTRPINPKLRDR